MSRTRGDDLEDDFVPDDLVDLSEDDFASVEGDDVGALLSPDEDGQQSNKKDDEKKRKRKVKDKERKAKASAHVPHVPEARPTATAI